MGQTHFSRKTDETMYCFTALFQCHGCFKIWMGEENVVFHLALIFRTRFFGGFASVIDRIEVLCVNNPLHLIC